MIIPLNHRNKIFLVFALGILISLFYAIFNLSKFDKNEQNQHLMIRGDIHQVWSEAESFKIDLSKNKTIFGNGEVYTRTFLQSKIIAINSFLSGEDLYENYNNKIVKLEGKLIHLIFQIIVYYLSLLYLYKKLLIYYDYKNVSFFIVAYLSLDPNIIQWHGTFWTESIFLSLQIILIALLITRNKSNIFCLSLGLFLGLMFLQKTVSIFYIIFISLFIYFEKHQNVKSKILSLFMGFIIILSLLGYDNYKKTDIFYVMPLQTKAAHRMSLIPQLLNEKDDLNSLNQLEKLEEDWMKKNNLSWENFYLLTNFDKRYEFRKLQQKNSIEIILDNKILTTKIYIKKIIHHLVLNPLQTFYWHKYNQVKYKQEFHLSDESKKYLIFKIFYSLIFYSILFLGFLSVLKDKKNLKFYSLLLILVCYLIFMLGWVGNSRYFVPSIIFLSIFFGHGINYINELRSKKL